MRYLLLISADEEAATAITTSDFPAWLADLEQRGVLEMHAGLHPSANATTVRRRDDEVLLTDGPFVEGREQVGGFALIDCRDLDEAVEIAAAHPAAAELDLLDRVGDHPLLPAARADLLRRAGRRDEAAGHYRTAVERAASPAERAYLERRLRE